MVTIVMENGRPQVYCKSTDEKPLNQPNATPLLEIDTGKVFIFDEDEQKWWPLQKQEG